MITFNFEEGCYQENYENNISATNTIDEEILETEENHDDSDSGIDSLYECIKFKTTSDSFHDPGLTGTSHQNVRAICLLSLRSFSPSPSEIFTPRQTHVTHPFSHPLPRECQISELTVAIRSEYSQCSALSLVCCLLRLIFFRSRKNSLKSPSTPNMPQHSICDNFRVIK